MSDIILKRNGGDVYTKVEVLEAAPAVTSSSLWVREDPDHFKLIRDVKADVQQEGELYRVGAGDDLDGKYLEWIWVATPAPGRNAEKGTVRITVLQGGKAVHDYPLIKHFDFDANGPVAYSLTRLIQVRP